MPNTLTLEVSDGIDPCNDLDILKVSHLVTVDRWEIPTWWWIHISQIYATPIVICAQALTTILAQCFTWWNLLWSISGGCNAQNYDKRCNRRFWNGCRKWFLEHKIPSHNTCMKHDAFIRFRIWCPPVQCNSLFVLIIVYISWWYLTQLKLGSDYLLLHWILFSEIMDLNASSNLTGMEDVDAVYEAQKIQGIADRC